jgi:hypothetical protein
MDIDMATSTSTTSSITMSMKMAAIPTNAVEENTGTMDMSLGDFGNCKLSVWTPCFGDSPPSY